MKVGLIAIIVLLGSFAVPRAFADSEGTEQFKISGNFAAIPTVIAAGVANWDITYPNTINGPGTYYVSISVHTTVPVATSMLTVSAGGAVASPGCTTSAIQDAVPSVSGVTAYISITIASGSNYCSTSLRFTLQTLAGAITVDNVRLTFVLSTDRTYLYLCDAPGDTPNDFTGATICNDLSIGVPDIAASIDNFTNALCRPTGNHGHCSLDIHGGIEICPEDSPCFVQTNSTITIMGNISFNQTNLPPITEEGWDGSLYIFLLVFAAIVAWFGEAKRDNYYRAFAGFVLLVAAFVAIWEIDRIGFDNFGRGAWFAIAFLLVELPLAFYLLIPKNFEKETKN